MLARSPNVRCRFASALALVATTTLAACPGRPAHDDSGDAPDVAEASADGAAEAAMDAGPVEEWATEPDVIRCGPDAVPYRTDIGRCSVAAPLPDGGPPATGRCTATVQPAALLRTNDHDGDAVVLPSGRRVTPGTQRRTLSGFPMSLLRIPGTSFVVVSDGGAYDEHLRVIDTSQPDLPITAGGDVLFAESGNSTDPALFYGLAYDATQHIVYAAGGGSDIIYAYALSEAGALTADATHTITLGVHESDTEGTNAQGQLVSAYPAGIALSDDGATLYAAMQRGHAIGVYATATGQPIAIVPVPITNGLPAYPYVLARRPGDATHLYVSLWGAHAVAEFDMTTNALTRTFDVGKNPTELLFTADGTQLYVAATDSDAISVIDLSMPSAPVTEHYLGGASSAARGISPDALAWGPNGRLYVAEEDTNAIEVLDPNTFTRIGEIPTEWYPSDLDVASDGSVIVVTGKGLGSGTNLQPMQTNEVALMAGSIERFAPMDDPTLAQGTATVSYGDSVMGSFVDVSCPQDAQYDFPVPRIGDGAPSAYIHHVVFIVRENKSYDGLLGDYTGTSGSTADGDPDVTVVPATDMPSVFPNLHALVRQFANHDNFYSNAELSIQGHEWTTTGRTTDLTERVELTTDHRGNRGGGQLPGVSVIGLPEEGDIFSAMRRANVDAWDWGEAAGLASGSQRAGSLFPGSYFDTSIADIVKARGTADYIQGTDNYGQNPTRVCVLKPFTYVCLPDDHTNGGDPNSPTPESMYRDNDEATGFLIDAISHSPFWPDTLIVIVEDDPAQGGDHVDSHRSIAVLVSPWVRHGYTSHVHTDVASVHHTIELILGVPPHNAIVAAAAPLYDAFTGTPDFTPYTYTPREACPMLNPMRGMWAERSRGMDFSRPDHAPGLDRLVWEMLHQGRPAPWREAREPDDDDPR